MDFEIKNAATKAVACRARAYGIWMNRQTKRPYRFSDEVLNEMVRIGK